MAMDNDNPIDRNRRLLGLALDCRLIYPRKKEKIEAILAERLKEDEAADVMDLLKEERVLNDEKAAYLLDLDDHTATCARDAAFGRLAVANQMASQKEVDAALAFQKTTFKTTGETMRLGRILADRGRLTEADCTAILMTQNRIRNEDLLDAMDRLARTPGEREQINRRFGAIALKKELVTMEQVARALGIQKEEGRRKEGRRFLGAILREVADLSQEDVDAVVQEQKLMEARRLDLLKAMYTAKEELKIFKRLNALFSYTISADGIEAYARKEKPLVTPVPVYELVIWLRKAGITFGLASDTVLAEFLEKDEPSQPVLVARGQDPVPGRDEGIRFYFEDPGIAETPEDGPEADNRIPAPGPVTRGDLLAQIIPGQEGKPGKNVMGHPVYPARPATRTLFPGKGVLRKGNDFLAAADGLPRLKNGTTIILESPDTPTASQTLTMDIREDTEDTYLQADLSIKGSILAGGVLKCRSLTLKGDLLGDVGCGGDIAVDGSLGREDAPKAEVLCHGSVRVAKSVANAGVLCAGTFLAMNASATGVRVCAGRGITLREVMAGPEGPSVLRAGLCPRDPMLSLDQTLEDRAAELETLTKREEISQLKTEYKRDMETALQHQMEQDIFHDLIQIIEGPELFQYPELRDKLNYLYSLPEYSSVRAYYMKIPNTRAASEVVDRFLAPANKGSLEEVLKQIRDKLDPEPERTEEAPISETERIEIAFNARLQALEQEVEENQEAIVQAEREISAMETAREKLGRTYVKPMAPGDFPAIRVKNKCEKGTVIQGILARLTLEETVYNVRFRETLDPGTRKATILIEN
jgi:hypothetical protein